MKHLIPTILLASIAFADPDTNYVDLSRIRQATPSIIYKEPVTIKFTQNLEPVIEIKQDGRFYYKGKLLAADSELYEAFSKFIKGSSCPCTGIK